MQVERYGLVEIALWGKWTDVSGLVSDRTGWDKFEAP